MRLLTYLTMAILLTNCDRQNSGHEVSKADQLRSLVRKIGVQELPYTYDLTKGPDNINYSIDPNSNDTLFIDCCDVGGVLPDTTNFYCILHYQPGDLVYPFISTFDKRGNLIDTENIGIGYCGGLTIDLDTCVDRVTIDKRLEIESYYQATGTAEDSIRQEVKICNSITGKGKITADGKIEMTKTELTDCL